MIILRDFDYHGVKVEELNCATKHDMVEALSALDYLAARQATPAPEAEEKAEDKPAPAKKTPARSRSKGKNTVKDAVEEEKTEDRMRYFHDRKTGEVFFDYADKMGGDVDEITEAKYHELRAEMEAAEKEAEIAKADEETAEDEAPAYTQDDMKAWFSKYLDAMGGPKTKELLSKYGAAKRSELKEEHFAEVVGVIKEALEKDDD